jgi:hypothetical protein
MAAGEGNKLDVKIGFEEKIAQPLGACERQDLVLPAMTLQDAERSTIRSKFPPFRFTKKSAGKYAQSRGGSGSRGATSVVIIEPAKSPENQLR